MWDIVNKPACRIDGETVATELKSSHHFQTDLDLSVASSRNPHRGELAWRQQSRGVPVLPLPSVPSPEPHQPRAQVTLTAAPKPPPSITSTRLLLGLCFQRQQMHTSSFSWGSKVIPGATRDD